MGSKKSYLVAILIQLIYSGMFLVSKSALNNGISSFVFVFYRQLVGSAALLPFALIFGRKGAPPMSIVSLCKIFGLSLIGGTLCINLNALGLSYTSATIGAAGINSLPVFTFIFALMFRMETMKLNTIRGMAKLVGLVLCMAGVLTLALYKGPSLKPLVHHRVLGSESPQGAPRQAVGSSKTWIMGCFFIFSSHIFWSLWLVLQTKFMESYPAKLLFATLQCLFSALQSFVFAMIMERNFQNWKLNLDVGLLAVIYTGALATGAVFYLQAWLMEKKGPVFTALFTPLTLLFTIIYSSVLLGQSVSLGTVISGSILAGSLYIILWAKSGEQKSPINLAADDEKDHENKEKEIKVVTLIVEDTDKDKLDR